MASDHMRIGDRLRISVVFLVLSLIYASYTGPIVYYSFVEGEWEPNDGSSYAFVAIVIAVYFALILLFKRLRQMNEKLFSFRFTTSVFYLLPVVAYIAVSVMYVFGYMDSSSYSLLELSYQTAIPLVGFLVLTFLVPFVVQINPLSDGNRKEDDEDAIVAELRTDAEIEKLVEGWRKDSFDKKSLYVDKEHAKRKARLTREINRLEKRGVLNLILGIIISFSGIFFLGYSILNTQIVIKDLIVEDIKSSFSAAMERGFDRLVAASSPFNQLQRSSTTSAGPERMFRSQQTIATDDLRKRLESLEGKLATVATPDQDTSQAVTEARKLLIDLRSYQDAITAATKVHHDQVSDLFGRSYDRIDNAVEKSTIDRETMYLTLGTRVFFVIMLEVFAFFFLSLYRQSLADMKYFQNELTNLDNQSLAIALMTMSANLDVEKDLLLRLASTERNFILDKGKTTVEIERDRVSLRGLDAIAKYLGPLIPKTS